MDLGVAEPDRDPVEPQRLALGIEPQRHRGAGAERRQQEIVWIGTAVGTAGIDRLIGQEAVRAGRDLLLKPPLPGLAHDHHAGALGSCAACGAMSR